MIPEILDRLLGIVVGVILTKRMLRTTSLVIDSENLLRGMSRPVS